jgi:NAD dependent epimerase/dehydratase family enzyme
VDAIVYCLENPKISGPVNVCSPNPVTNSEFTAALGGALGRPTIFPLPEIIGKIIFGQFGEETILGGQKAIPSKLLSSGFKFQNADIYSALMKICR